MTERCIELVKSFEGFFPHIYLCPAGVPTVGYGHVVHPSEAEKFKDGITEEEAERILIRDLFYVESKIIPLIKVPIHFYMLDALVSFAFNVGTHAFEISTLRRKLNREEYMDAADEFLRWVYAGGRKLRGLIRRREAERALFLEGLKIMHLFHPQE